MAPQLFTAGPWLGGTARTPPPNTATTPIHVRRVGGGVGRRRKPMQSNHHGDIDSRILLWDEVVRDNSNGNPGEDQDYTPPGRGLSRRQPAPRNPPHVTQANSAQPSSDSNIWGPEEWPQDGPPNPRENGRPHYVPSPLTSSLGQTNLNKRFPSRARHASQHHMGSGECQGHNQRQAKTATKVSLHKRGASIRLVAGGASDIGTRSIRSGAAMGLFLMNHPVAKIMILGCWSSDACLV